MKFLAKFGMKYGEKLLASEGRKEMASAITKGLNQFGEGVRNGTEKLLGRGIGLGDGLALAGGGTGRTIGFSMERGGQTLRFSRGLDKEVASKLETDVMKPSKRTREVGKETIESTSKTIPRSDYAKLRKKTPNEEIRNMVNPEGPKVDPVYGYSVEKLEADHIVPMKEITQMPGFSDLPEVEQVKVLNLVDNFLGLGKSTNASKGAKTWLEWQGHSKLGPVPEDVRQEMLKAEQKAKEAIMEAIEKGLNKK